MCGWGLSRFAGAVRWPVRSAHRIVLDKQFALASGRWFNAFFWTYNTGLVVTVAMMVAHGILTVLNHDVSPAISGIARLGHILLSVGFAIFCLCLRGPIKTAARETGDAPQNAEHMLER